MKGIKLTQGKAALVDDEDYEYLNQFRWHVRKGRRHFYAGRYSKLINGKQKPIHMHRIIMKTPDDLQVDHIDFNGLNNQKNNLRNCTHGQNQMNRKASGKSKYLGVSYQEEKYIIAVIRVNKKLIYLGRFNTEIKAAFAYNKAAKKYHGEFANLNILK